ncbi:AMP-binding protein [Vibrio ruber]|uniref:AMP-binding protein n=1 Tax=Vibrio ruber TaxID=184755 RepID=UPI002892A224|nr:AMP-binding protein [Vibrio ruber]WNJ94139.1 AMP-binding protein [Vibrio ruber]
MHSKNAHGLKSVPDIFSEVSTRFPDRVALVYQDRKITYSQLYEESLALAAVLQNHSLIRGNIVALKIERSPELYLFMLALLKIGAVVLPINPRAPALYTRDVLETAGASCIIIDDEANAPEGTWQLLKVMKLIQESEQQTVSNFPELSVNEPAIMLMTSGSTGKPKSVLIAHRGIARLSLQVPALGNSERDCYLQIADASFAASANEIWMSLLTGARLTIAPPGLPDLTALTEQIKADGVTVLFLSGGLFRLFVEVAIDTLHVPDSVVVSGDFVNPRLFTMAIEAGNSKIFNGLGCTENSAISSLFHVQRGGDISFNCPLPVGTPLPLVEMVVLNEQLIPCSCGEYGELFIAGAGLALGYSDQQLTAERFITLPYQGREVRFYRTDDQATYDQEHNVVLVGRGNHICKIRGYRINITGIEHTLRLHPAIDDVLIVMEETPDEPRLNACYVTQSDDLSAVELTQFLSQHVPSWMIPEKFSRLAVLPMTANGKRDRLQLSKTFIEQA